LELPLFIGKNIIAALSVTMPLFALFILYLLVTGFIF
jgi:hypothetical protein